jgi:hypothetical protein
MEKVHPAWDRAGGRDRSMTGAWGVFVPVKDVIDRCG